MKSPKIGPPLPFLRFLRFRFLPLPFSAFCDWFDGFELLNPISSSHIEPVTFPCTITYVRSLQRSSSNIWSSISLASFLQSLSKVVWALIHQGRTIYLFMGVWHKCSMKLGRFIDWYCSCCTSEPKSCTIAKMKGSTPAYSILAISASQCRPRNGYLQNMLISKLLKAVVK